MNDTPNDTEGPKPRGALLWLAPLAVSVAVILLVWGAVISANRPEPPAAAPEAPTTTTSATTAPPSGGGGGDAAKGEEIFRGTCAACHGQDAKGIPGLGHDLTNNSFIQGLSDDELVAFIEEGRPADHPDNTTGVAMPPKGGNPTLTEADLRDVVAFLRTLQ
ncbi:MAG TPA: cytochrome c [Actinobacteria bacterium]|nr:cytochrome c [Actinomycetota bacterium]